MPDENKPSRYEPVAKTVMTLTMVHPIAFNPSKMSQEDVAYHLGDGEFIGARTAINTSPLADENVEEELQSLGNDGTFFEKAVNQPLEANATQES